MAAIKKVLQVDTQIMELVMNIADANLRDPLTLETEILELNLIDSFGLLQLISDIEQKFNINISTEEMTLENFSTISAIADLITRYQSKS